MARALRGGALAAATLLFVAGAGTAAAAPSAPAGAGREAAAEIKLAELKRRVGALVAAQQRAEAARSGTIVALREADARVAEAQARAAAAAAEQARLASALATLEVEHEALTLRLTAQREALARLVRAAYAAGRHEQLKLLLAQDQIGAIGRTLAYHRHVQQQRVRQVRAVLDELAALAALGAEVKAQRDAVAEAAAAAAAAVVTLAAERERRRASLVAIEAEFKDREARIAALGRDQQAVEALLAELRDVLADIPKRLEEDRPFASRRGELALPVGGGRVLERFGTAIAGGQRSAGVRFAVAPGAPVRAVAPGRVAYADWLTGYGLLLILDHGDGWMSLYAHSDRLERAVGDWVGSGDIVARAGSSGGASESALYFELRRDGQPVDPRGWWR